MDEKTLLRRFYLRSLLVVGMLWGGMPLIELPLLFKGPAGSPLIVFSVIFNGLTVLPASALAFWHRRIACIWLSFNAAILVLAWAAIVRSGRHFDISTMLGVCGSIALALSLDFIELRRWPVALVR